MTGSDSFSTVDCGEIGNINVRTVSETRYQEGDRVGLVFDPARLHFFHADGERA